ncbi:Mgat1 [Columba livia]|nr:Mgat1 [Columba livia]
MPKRPGWAAWGAALFLAWNLLLLFLWSRPAPSSSSSSSRLTAEVIRLAQAAESHLERQQDLLRQIQRYRGLWSRRRPLPLTPQPAPDPSDPVLPVLVLACDRSTVRRCLDALLRYRPSARRFPVIVSQDCGHAETARVIASYGAAVAHIRQPDLADVPAPPEHRKFQGYYRIARHYRWALGQVFRTFRYRAVIVVEDDLEVAPDFFEYFQAALPLLLADRSLCHGQFFDQYLKFIKLNDRFVPFTQLDLSYLKKDEYERRFLAEVYGAPEVRLEELRASRERQPGPVRLQYRDRDAFKTAAKALGLMDDLKSGVPRAGYRGIVSFVHRGRRVFLAPPPDWNGYDPSWS